MPILKTNFLAKMLTTDFDLVEDGAWEFDDAEQDFTACSEKCGYCGRC